MVEPPHLIIGLRAYGEKDSFKELEFQIRQSKTYFPNTFVSSTICGKEAPTKIQSIIDKIIHYSDKMIRLTPPLHELIKYAKDKYAKDARLNQLILTGGDNQHIFSEIRRVYEEGIKVKADAVIPTRKNKNLAFSDNKVIDRTLEEVENAFLRIKTGCKLGDPQPGFIILLNQKAIQNLNLEGIPSMIGDLVITDQLLRQGYKIIEPPVTIRKQKRILINVQREMLKVKQFEKYFRLSFKEAIKTIQEKPNIYLKNGTIDELQPLLDTYSKTFEKRAI